MKLSPRAEAPGFTDRRTTLAPTVKNTPATLRNGAVRFGNTGPQLCWPKWP